MTASNFNAAALVSRRSQALDNSGIRRAFELGARMEDPINLSIGQPDFPVPERMKDGVVDAVRNDQNAYTLTQGSGEALEAIASHLGEELGWSLPSDDMGLLVTSGTSGAILLALLATLDPGDEVVLADPAFVIYSALVTLSGGTAVHCDTYPDFHLTAARIESLLTPRTRIVLVNSPGNPTGVVLPGSEMRDLVTLCESRGILLVSDEIYDAFTYTDAREDGRCPTPAHHTQNMLLVRGFGKTWGCTGWRLGYAAGPKPILDEMRKLQQYTFICAPSITQAAIPHAFTTDMAPMVASYEAKRDMVVDAFRGIAEMAVPGGAFYAFVEVPPALGLTATLFAAQALEQHVLIIPGEVFSRRDTHFRISFATSDETLARGLGILRDLCKGG